MPSFTAFAVVGLLERYFGDLVDYGFTASMEDDLDEIAAGREEALPWLTRFYFGSAVPGATNGHGEEVEAVGLKATVAAHLSEIDAREINSIPLGDGSDGEPIVARVGRYGPYLQRGEDRASIPDDLAPDELTIERAEEILAAPSNDRVLGTDPESGLDVQVKAGRFGPYVQVGEVDRGRGQAAHRVAVLVHGPGDADARAGARAAAHPAHGRGRPRDGRGDRGAQRALRAVPQARVRHAQPDERGPAPHGDPGRGARALRAAQAAPGHGRPHRRCAELGTDPTTNLPVVVKEGRFGPYVTDGTTNASLRKGDAVESIDMDRASELLAERRAAGPSKKKKAREEGRARQEEGDGEEGHDGEEDRRSEEGPGDQEGGGCDQGGGEVRAGWSRGNEGCADRPVLTWRPGVA